MDNEYHPEKPDIETALKCKEYLFQIFPNGIQEKTQNMTHEEIIELFKKIEKDAEQLLDVHIDNIDFYTTEEPPYCNYCGFYCHDEHSFHINTVFILSRIPELIEEQVYTIFHELKHARQWAAIEGKLNGTKDYGYSDEQIKMKGKGNTQGLCLLQGLLEYTGVEYGFPDANINTHISSPTITFRSSCNITT